MSKPESHKSDTARGTVNGKPARLAAGESLPLATRLWHSHVRKLWPRLVVVLIVTAIAAGTTGLYPVIINHALRQLHRARYRGHRLSAACGGAGDGDQERGALSAGGADQPGATRIETELQIELYDHLVAADIARLSRETPAALTQRFTTDLGFIREALTRATSSLVRDAMTLVAVFGAMIWLDWQLSLMSLLILPFAIVPIQRIGKRVRRVTTTQQEQMGLMAGLVRKASVLRGW